jgi:hypothetical protein
MDIKRFIFFTYAEWARAHGQEILDSFISASYGPRVFVHDFSHIVSGMGFYLKGEEASGIVQAVLWRDLTVKSSRIAFPDPTERDIPAFDQFDDNFYAKIKRHANLSWRRLHSDAVELPSNQFTPLTSERRRHYYQLAVDFDFLYESKYGKPFYQVSPHELSGVAAIEIVPLIFQAWRKNKHFPNDRLTVVLLREFNALTISQKSAAAAVQGHAPYESHPG